MCGARLLPCLRNEENFANGLEQEEEDLWVSALIIDSQYNVHTSTTGFASFIK